MFKHGNPLILQGSGRIKTDSLNEKRIQTVLSRFQEWTAGQGQMDRFRYAINSTQQQRSLIAFPVAGLAFGAISSLMFVHPNSQYIGKCFTLLTTYLGYQAHLLYTQSYNHSKRFGNFWNYPVDIRRMIDNNDARYAHRWLNDDYLKIQNSQ